MARVKTRKKLVDVCDIVREILESQPTDSKIEIVFEKTDNRRRLVIRGNKDYVLLSYENRPTKLFVNGDIIRDDIKSIPKRGVVSDIESFLYWNPKKFEFKEYKDLMTDNIVFEIRKVS